MFSIIETGGKQFKVSVGDKIKVDKLEAKEGDKITFDKVLLFSDDKDTKIGEPYVSGSKVTAEVLGQKRGKKLIVFRYKAKKRVRIKRGHKQDYTELEIKEIK